MSAVNKLALIGMIAALAACDQDGGEGNVVIPNGVAPDAELEVLPPDESASTPSNDLAAGVVDTRPREGALAPNPKTAIPAALHGRWGLTRADCDGESGVKKGLIAISAENIRFHNSIASPQTTHEITPRGIRAEFAFVGEGGIWTNPMIWAVEDKTLVRIDSEADSRLVYTRC